MSDINYNALPEKTTPSVSWDKVIITDSEDWNIVKIQEALQFKWPQGEQGEQWEQGIQWIQWEVWPTGPTWPKWDTWDTWPTGPTWPQWIQGIQWETWPAGTNWTDWLDITWLWAYNWATSYVINDAISYNWSSYICKLASTGNLPTNATYFDLMAQKWDAWAWSWDMLKSVYDTNNEHKE